MPGKSDGFEGVTMKLLLSALVYGLSFAGFLGGLWLGYWIEINLLGSTPETTRVWPALIVAFLASVIGREIGLRLKSRMMGEAPPGK